MKTRARKVSAVQTKDGKVNVACTTQAMEPSVREPPHIFVLPEHLSSAARIATFTHPATCKPARVLVDPERGFYEFTQVTAQKEQCRSWLLAPAPRDDKQEKGEEAQDVEEQSDTQDNAEAGYVLQTPDLLIATPIDPLFLILNALTGDQNTVGQEYLAPSDYIAVLASSSLHLRQIISDDIEAKLEKLLSSRIEAVCDCMDMGDEKLYALSLPKLTKELICKAEKMAAKGLPASMEERFVRQALEMPVLGIRREESSISVATEASQTSDPASEQVSQDTDGSASTSVSTSTAATSISGRSADLYPSFSYLLRIRVALQFLGKSYLAPRLEQMLQTHMRDSKLTGIDFAPLDMHLARIESLKKEAQALRSLSDNISRKRATMEDDDDLVMKKQKKEEAEEKRKNVSLGVKKLLKADTSGMKKLSSFFGKKG